MIVTFVYPPEVFSQSFSDFELCLVLKDERIVSLQSELAMESRELSCWWCCMFSVEMDTWSQNSQILRKNWELQKG